MKIEPFKMKVTPEQSRIVQEILFENGYSWYSGGTTVRNMDEEVLYFYGRTDDPYKDKPGLTWALSIEGDPDIPILTYEEFIDKYEFELPEKWCIKPETLEQSKLIGKWLDECFSDVLNQNFYENSGMMGLYFGNNEPGYVWGYGPSQGFEEITFEQFKKYVLREETMDKKIIGYKLIKPEYEKIALKALGLQSAHKPFIIAGMLGYYVPKIKELGIMDWFEPLYEAEFKDGDWVYVLSDCPGGSKLKQGDVGKVTCYDNPTPTFRVITNETKEANWVEPAHVRKATPEEIKAAQEVKMPFGTTTVIVTKDTVTLDGGYIVSFLQIDELVKMLIFSLPQIQGYQVKLGLETVINIGCKSGTLKEVLDIYNKMKKLQ